MRACNLYTHPLGGIFLMICKVTGSRGRGGGGNLKEFPLALNFDLQHLWPKMDKTGKSCSLCESGAYVCEHSQKLGPHLSWLTFTRDTPTPHAHPRPPPFTFSPFYKAGLCHSLLMGHTHEMFVLRTMWALPIALERTMPDLLELGRDPCDFLMAMLWVNRCFLGTVRTLGACAPKEQIVSNVQDRAHVPVLSDRGGERGPP